jgi:uncharacterized protein YukE
MTRKKILPICLAVLFLGGCGEDISTIEKKVLERDPSFQEILDLKNSMSKELEQAQIGYFTQKRKKEAQIASLKQDLEKARGEHAAKMDRIRKKLDPEISALRNTITSMKREAGLKRSELRMIEKSIREIRELVQKGKNLEMTQEEMRMWNERMTAFVKKREDIVKDLDKTAADIETAELKMVLMAER